MDRHELNEMFDGLAPNPARERELLRRLLQDDARRKKPMKHWKRVVIGAVAAALLMTAAAAVAVPKLNQRFLDYMNVDPADTEAVAKVENLLLPGAMELDITKEDNGSTLHVTQILRDRTSIMVLAEFTAPEGTVLDMGDFDDPEVWHPKGFVSALGAWPHFINEAGEQIEESKNASRVILEREHGYWEIEERENVYWKNGFYHWQALKDEDRQDNQCSLMFRFTTHLGENMMKNAAAIWIPATNFSYYIGGERSREAVCTGNWSFEIPMPQKDIGYIWKARQVIGELDGLKITLESVYLSPLTLVIIVSREGGLVDVWTEEKSMRWQELLDSAVTLNTKDGKTVDLGSGYGIGMESWGRRYDLMDVIDPAEFQGGTLVLDLSCGKVTLPLDDLMPVEP